MSEVHAAIGLVHMRRLDEFISVRQRVAARYDDALRAIPGIEPLLPPANAEHCYYKYTALLAPGIDRDSLKARLREEHGVGMSGEVYARPLHHEPIFADVAHGPLPVAEDVCARHVCLPIHSDMTEDEADLVTEALAAELSEHAGAVASAVEGSRA
jgi:dTDP-4-amino-4,6-dideoxygalactose transaminase